MVLQRILVITLRWLYLIEILSFEWIGYGIVSCWIATGLVLFAAPYCFDYIGRWTFFIFLVITAGSGLFFWKLLPETKNKNADEILKEFESNTVESIATNAVINILMETKGKPNIEQEVTS
jgi:hypothetical protein